MCGLFFSTNPSVTKSRSRIEAFIGRRGTRAPVWHEAKNGWIFAHALLPVQGERPFKQPVVKDDHVLVFGGELWTQHSVRRSDTEYLFQKLINSAPSRVCGRLDGMWAFVFSSARSGRIWFATDAVGEQPLHYAIQDSHLYIASEIKVLLAAGVAFRGVKHVLPGHLYSFRTQLRVVRYVPSSEPEPWADFSDRALRKRISQSVSQQVRACDMQECAILLSGGIDSSIIAHEAAKLGIRRAFVVSMSDSDIDAVDAQFAARELGIKLESLVARPEPIRRTIARVEHANRSIVEELALHAILASHLNKRGIRILLTGCGADELFLGYKHLLGRVPHHELQRQFLSSYYRFDLRAFNKLYGGFALELRHPFLSRSVISYAARIHYKLLLGPKKIMKWPLRRAYSGILPTEITSKPKYIARESMGARQHFRPKYGESPYCYRPIFREVFRDYRSVSSAMRSS